VKSLIVITLVIVLKVFANVSLSEGMTQIGEIEFSRLLDPLALFVLGFQTLTNFWIILAMFLLVIYIILFLSALSWLDLSYLLPMTTLGYALNALLAWLLLGEEIAITRWMGTLLIMIGVLVVGIGGHRRSKRKKIDAAERQQESNTSPPSE